MDDATASLNYLSLGIGFVIGLQISHPMIDKASASACSPFIVPLQLTD